ncbi:hypothetical protein LXA43DRAFT_1098174 [Ganoderma leucocontextum]|nr:hypothetical protein LXA43DRAFT_1098174 [Ganoderma leucocontextum]
MLSGPIPAKRSYHGPEGVPSVIPSLKGNEFENVKYAVFGCGNRDWIRTYQRIPKATDAILEQRRGTRLLESRVTGDARTAEFFDEWEAKSWNALAAVSDRALSLVEPPAVVSALSIQTVDVIEKRLPTSSSAPWKRHIEFELPEQTTYRARDYLAIGTCTGLPQDSVSPLPVEHPISIAAPPRYVELSQPATTRDLRILLSSDSSDATKTAIQDFQASNSEKEYADIKLSSGTYLEMLPAMRVRQHSISSSPFHNAQRPTLSVSVVEAPALSGKTFFGVASNILVGLRTEDVIQLAMRAASAAFHALEDPSRVPMVMFAAGSGLAPMRGFLQERAEQRTCGLRSRSTAFSSPTKMLVANTFVTSRRSPTNPYQYVYCRCCDLLH